VAGKRVRWIDPENDARNESEIVETEQDNLVSGEKFGNGARRKMMRNEIGRSANH
jgi:hypothetical protein